MKTKYFLILNNYFLFSIKRKLLKIKILGFSKIIHGIMEYQKFLKLEKQFDFDHWHTRSPYSWSLYKSIVVEITKTLKPDSVIEVGCGLAEILERTRARVRYGVDADEKVISAARQISNCVFINSSLEDLPKHLDDSQQGQFDGIILVNTAHAIQESILIKQLKLLNDTISLRWIIIDQVLGNTGFSHELSNLDWLFSKSQVYEVPLGERKIWIHWFHEIEKNS